MFILDNKPLLDEGFTIGEGEEAVTYPPGWLALASAEELELLGITVVSNTPEELNEQIKNQILQLEFSANYRRMREAILGIDNGWLAALNDQIVQLRARLKK